VTGRAVAGRYARALFDVVLAERADLQRTEAELTGFSQLVLGNEQLARVLTNPAIPMSKKRAVLEQLIARLGSMLPQVSKLLLLLADRDRLSLLPDILQAYRNRLMDHYNVVRAEVVTAIHLPADRLTALETGLFQATGRKIQLEARVDPAIIGGAVARIGSTVYDGSITTQLQKMRETLAAGGE
jgi:F-type H+-transporting ATPase subunit delta